MNLTIVRLSENKSMATKLLIQRKNIWKINHDKIHHEEFTSGCKGSLELPFNKTCWSISLRDASQSCFSMLNFLSSVRPFSTVKMHYFRPQDLQQQQNNLQYVDYIIPLTQFREIVSLRRKCPKSHNLRLKCPEYYYCLKL